MKEEKNGHDSSLLVTWPFFNYNLLSKNKMYHFLFVKKLTEKDFKNSQQHLSNEICLVDFFLLLL
jgi:hypothetical protein